MATYQHNLKIQGESVSDKSVKRTHFNPSALLGFLAICGSPGVFAFIQSRSPDRATACLYLGLCGLAALNVVLTWAIAADRGLLVRQKVRQTLVVWLIPALGGLFIGIFMWTECGSAPATGYPGDTGGGPRNVYLGSHPPGPPGGC